MNEALEAKLNALAGRRSSQDEIDRIKADVPWVPQWLLELMIRYPLAGAKFTLDESSDYSEIGVEMRWLTADQITDEAVNNYPGIAAARQGYLPIGQCLIGTGDPYFVRADSAQSPVYRIPHTAVAGEVLLDDRIELVSPSLPAFFAAAR